MSENTIIEQHDDNEYDASGNILTAFTPTKYERSVIKQILTSYPNLDEMMALTLIRSSPEELQKIVDTMPDYKPMNTTIIKDAFALEPLTEEQIKEKEEREKKARERNMLFVDYNIDSFKNILIT